MINSLNEININIRFRKTISCVVVFLSLLFFNITNAEAQDDHYWAQQYGAESTLLGGAVVGGIRDNSAVYYNPAALSFITHPSLSIDANVYRYDKILISDGAGNGVNLNSAQLSIYPQIVSGMINLVKTEKLKLSYTLLTRNHANVLINSRYTDKASDTDPSDPLPSATSFVGAFDYVNQIDELWFGVGSGYRLSDKLAIGATIFGCYRGQSYQLTNYVRQIEYTDPDYVYRNTTNDEAIKYTAVRMLSKLGIAYESGRMKYGLTFTTPSFGIYGRGSVQRENSNIVVSANPADLAKNFMIIDSKSDVKANYRHPMSVAFGLDYQDTKTRVAISAEYFSKIGTYNLMKPDEEPLVYPPTYLDSANYKPMIDNYLLTQNAARSVFNIGIGLSHVIYKQLTLLLGTSTDFSSYYKEEGVNELMHGFGNWDSYHFSSGLSYQRQKHAICLGFSYTLTPSKYIPPYTIINQAQTVTDNALMTAHSYSIILGYTYFFARTE